MSDNYEFENEINEEPILDEDFNSNEFKSSKYSTDSVEVLIDSNSESLIDKSTLTPLDYIKSLAAKLGHTLKNPKANCKHCYGRGHENYIAPGSNALPIPCRCIYTKETLEADNNMPKVVNREQRRRMDKLSNKIAKEYRKRFKNKGYEEQKQKELN